MNVKSAYQYDPRVLSRGLEFRPFALSILFYCFLLQSMPQGWITRSPLSESVQTQEQSQTRPIQLQYTSARHVLGFGASQVVVGSRTHALTITLANEQPVEPVVEGEDNPKAGSYSKETSSPNMPGMQKTEVFIGSVGYSHPWPKVNVIYRAQPGAIVKSEYQIEAGFSKKTIAQIRVHYNRPVEVVRGGGLQIKYALGSMQECKPIAWQEIHGQKVPVPVEFHKVGAQVIGFEVGQANSRYPLVIDPSLTWNTFVGSGESEDDFGCAIVVDTGGNIYMTGRCNGPWGPVVRGYSSGFDAFVAKLNSSGNLLWSSFLGGAGGDFGNGLAADGSGNVFVGGYSNATWGTPVRGYSSGIDAFAAKLDSNGVLLWNTFLGSGGSDFGNAVAVDGSGNVAVVGYTSATWGNPVRGYSSGDDAFLAKLDSNGVLLWNTFLGSGGSDYGNAVAVDGSGKVVVAGYSNAMWGTPVRGYSSGNDAFSAKLDSNGAVL